MTQATTTKLFGHATQCCNKFRQQWQRQRLIKTGWKDSWTWGRTFGLPLALIKPRRHNKLQLGCIVTALSGGAASEHIHHNQQVPKGRSAYWLPTANIGS